MITVYLTDSQEALAAIAAAQPHQVRIAGTETIIDTDLSRPVPRTVGARAFKEALILSGLMSEADAFVAASGNALLQNDWRESSIWVRSNPRLIAAVLAMGKTEADLDDLFVLADSLEVRP